ncbi:type II toxin-antitoxin system prevent-host-death family antitoxin [Thioalkalicoccus limnaeus]|uniref:Type II toxin-antitoxin system prevent-host-death family antitoxin n=1 Tax=Thioalkalicoccus limnaeus TaxID=120681 RepID=A0ABV4BDR3_9GAMM
MVIFWIFSVRCVQITEAKAKLSGLLAAVEAGETIAIMRRGRVIARLVPEKPSLAADAFRPFWADHDEIDLVAPEDAPPERVQAW